MPLGDFVTLQRGHDLPEARRRPGDAPVLGSFGVTGWHDTARAAGPGVTVGRSGASFGVVSYSPVDYWPLNTTLYVVDFHGNDQRFAYYFLKQLDFRIYNSGSAQPSLNRNFIHPIPVDIPPLREQRAIAHVLGTLDDKIELNRRMNETLEEMARALFKSWFVDFDPVRAKTALKQHALGDQPPLAGEPNGNGAPTGEWTVERARAYLAGMDPQIADLFPDRLVDSELGEIPEGWEVKALGDVAEQRRDGLRPEQIDPATPYIALEHMPRRCIALGDWGSADDLASAKFRFAQGDILFGKLRPYFNKVGVAPLDGVCSTDIVVVSPASPCWFSFVLGHTSSLEFMNYSDAVSTGTRMPRTKWADMARYKVALPKIVLARASTDMIQPQMGRIVSAVHKSRSLAAIRDALLIKLISGSLRKYQA